MTSRRSQPPLSSCQTLKAKGPAICKTLPRDRPDHLSYQNQILLKRFLLTISKGERSIEK